MEQIINKLWKQKKSHLAEWTGDAVAEYFFKQGCQAILDWEDEQRQMDRDYQEELNQQEALRRGEG